MGCHRAQNMIYDFIKVGGDALRLLWRNVCWKISAYVNGLLSGGSRVRRPGSEDPHRRERKFTKADNHNHQVIMNKVVR